MAIQFKIAEAQPKGEEMVNLFLLHLFFDSSMYFVQSKWTSLRASVRRSANSKCFLAVIDWTQV